MNKVQTQTIYIQFEANHLLYFKIVTFLKGRALVLNINDDDDDDVDGDDDNDDDDDDDDSLCRGNS